MYSSAQQIPIRPDVLSVQVPSAMNYGGQNESSNVANHETEPVVNPSKKLENDMLLLGKKIKQHEENIKYLKTHKNILDDEITDKQVTLGKYHSSTEPKIEDGDISQLQSEDATIKNIIMKHEKSAAAIFCQLKHRHKSQAAHIKDVLGVVATLGKVNDDNLNWLLSEYLGVDNMLSLVCITYDGIKALATYDKDGSINKNSGLYDLGTAIGQPLEGRFNVICLENIRPYVGEFMTNDPQKRLDLLKPKLPNGETPVGFIGFAVNMIHIDDANLFYLTHDGNGLRETLFYTLFSRLQVYKTRREMVEAVACISDGAISLDGGIIKGNGVYSLGTREEIDVRFPKTSGGGSFSYLPVEVEKEMKEVKWRRERMMDEIQREEAMLAHVKYSFEVKKQEFLGLIAQSSRCTMPSFKMGIPDVWYLDSSDSSDSSEGDRLFIEAVRVAVDFVRQQVDRPILTRVSINRNRQAAHDLLVQDYFCDDPTYKEKQFMCRFRMSRNLFLRICSDLEEQNDYFKQKYDARGRLGFSALQKCTSAIRQLGYGTCADSWDDYLNMSEKTSRDTLYKFCKGIIRLYREKYMRRPNWNDIQQLYDSHEERHGFPGMVGSIGCIGWEWDNCPTAWRGQYNRGDHQRPTIMLEAIASHDLWIWHAFFGVGSNNDINVLDESPVFNDMKDGTAFACSFICNDIYYKYGYYLSDGSYPNYATLVKSFSTMDADNEKSSYFKKRQESARKDIERAFQVLKKKWHIINNPARAWKPNKIRNAMYACLILHNMILEDKGLAICQHYDDMNENQHVEISEDERQENRSYLRNEDIHTNLKTDLVERLWADRPRSMREGVE